MKKRKTIYHLSACSTCKKILESLPLKGCELRDIKAEPMSEGEVDELARLAGSYEVLFSRKAIKYRTLNLKDKKLGEKDYRKYILQDYTFLRRPVVVAGDSIFIGNAAAQVNAARQALSV
jgi:arsenate reductase